VAVKEIEEETGLNCTVDGLLAIYDKRMHMHPPQPFYVYNLIFLCKIQSGNLNYGFDMEGAKFFNIADLPNLSEDRILAAQIQQLYTMVIDNITNVYFD